jgi:class 3 adenylate cyclase
VDAILDEIEEFLTGERHSSEPDRILATILFTDIVGSTDRAAALGDRRWRDLLESFYGVVRRELPRFRGLEVSTAGDGVLATFDGPARGVRCARSIADGIRPLGIELRTGLHTGECEVIDDNVGGIAVHTAARVATLAAPGEVLVTHTVRDLVAGSGLCFESRGTHTLKGVPGEWPLFAAIGSTMTHATRSSSTGTTLYGSTRVSRTAPSVTPAEPGSPSVATPLPDSARRKSP